MGILFLGFRSLLFYIGYIALVIFFSLTGALFFSYLPLRIRTAYIFNWNRCTVFWAKLICGLRYEVSGIENLPKDRPYVALAKHQSQWETYFLQPLLTPVKVVLKQELLSVPIFGWGLRLTDPIAIDRSNPRQAIKKIQQQGVAAIKDDISVLIFPEGTRITPGEMGNFARGGSNIAVESGADIIPIALNAGVYWPSDKFIKYPGTISVVIGPAISSVDKTSRELTQEVKDWMSTEMSKLPSSR